MYLLRYFRKPNVAIFLAFLVLFVSCVQYDNNLSNENETNSVQFTDEMMLGSLLDLDERLQTIDVTNKILNNEEEIYQKWLLDYNYEEFENPSYRNEARRLLNLAQKGSYFDYLKSSKSNNDFELSLLYMIDKDIRNNNNLKKSIEELSSMIDSGQYKDRQLSQIQLLLFMVKYFDLSFNEDNMASILSVKWQCYLSIAAMGITIAGLGALTAGSAWAVLAVAGVSLESVLLVASCRCHFKNECATNNPDETLDSGD